MGTIVAIFIFLILIPALLGKTPDEIFAGLGILIGLYIVARIVKSVMDFATKTKKEKRIAAGGYKTPHEFEKYVAHILTEKGYVNVEVTRHTGDYGADIICRDKRGVKWAVQCKMYSKPVGYRAIEEVLGAMHVYGCDAAMVVTNSTYTKQAVTAANRAGVKLMEYVR
ncbi:MAG: restriction endonuclease [Clostridia bacterium]|nr:restriction endonuclease [Clostridia bacterium]